MKFKLILIMAAVISSLSSCGKANVRVLAPTDYVKFIEGSADIVLLDVRTPEEFSQSHLPEAVNIDFNTPEFLATVEKQIPVDRNIAVYCRSGRRSLEAANKLSAAGYNVVDLEGGILNWEKAELPVTDGTYDFYTTKGGKEIKIEPLIHASIRIVFNDKEIEIDPVGTLGNRTTDYSRFPKADMILITHEHHDHLDPQAVRTLSKNDTIVIANANSAGILGFGEVMKNGDKRVFADGIEIEAVPAYNVSPDRLQFHPKGRDNGYILTLDGLRIYIAGDTEVIPEMEKLGKIDIAFLPCNLPYTMTPGQFVEAAEKIKPRVVYPYHYGTTDLTSITPALAPTGIYVRICPFDP